MTNCPICKCDKIEKFVVDSELIVLSNPRIRKCLTILYCEKYRAAFSHAEFMLKELYEDDF